LCNVARVVDIANPWWQKAALCLLAMVFIAAFGKNASRSCSIVMVGPYLPKSSQKVE